MRAYRSHARYHNAYYTGKIIINKFEEKKRRGPRERRARSFARPPCTEFVTTRLLNELTSITPVSDKFAAPPPRTLRRAWEGLAKEGWTGGVRHRRRHQQWAAAVDPSTVTIAAADPPLPRHRTRHIHLGRPPLARAADNPNRPSYHGDRYCCTHQYSFLPPPRGAALLRERQRVPPTTTTMPTTPRRRLPTPALTLLPFTVSETAHKLATTTTVRNALHSSESLECSEYCSYV